MAAFLSVGFEVWRQISYETHWIILQTCSLLSLYDACVDKEIKELFYWLIRLKSTMAMKTIEKEEQGEEIKIRQ
jgi:hypothetical protein